MRPRLRGLPFVLVLSIPASALEPTDDWGPVLEKLLESFAPLADWRAMALRIEPPPPANTEEEALDESEEEAAIPPGLLPPRGTMAKPSALIAIVEDEGQPASHRAQAMEAAMASPWPGRDEWFIGLFANKSLGALKEGHTLYRPLCSVVEKDPDRLIPKIVPLVGSENRAVHDNAVEALAQLDLEPRADALRPLLPWLQDRSWSTGEDRGLVIRGLCKVKLPESVPGLVHFLRTEKFLAREGAARALAYQEDPRALPALDEVLVEERNEQSRRPILEAIAACGGFDAERKAAAVEAYARQVSTAEGAERWKEALRSHGKGPEIDPRVSAGLFLSDGSRLDEDVVARLVARSRSLEESEPEVALSFRRLFAPWPQRAAARCIADWIESGPPDLNTVEEALANRKSLALHAVEQLRRTALLKGYRGGIAAVFIGDAALFSSILSGDDRERKIALLACARCVRASLPVGKVGELLSGDGSLLSRAAEAYLLAEDGREAREIVLSYHPGEMLILGRRTAWDPGHYSFESLGEWGEVLVREMKRPDGPDEIIALLSAGYFGDVGQAMVLARGESAELLRRPDPERYVKRELTDGEWRELRAFIEDTRFFDLPALETRVHDGIQYEAIRVTRRGGRRVFMNNPGTDGSAGTPYDLFVRLFARIAGVPGEPLRYDVMDSLPGARLVFSGKEDAIRVWGDERGVLVKMEGGSWRALAGGDLGDELERPAEWPPVDRDGIEEYVQLYSHLTPSPWQATLRDRMVLACTDENGGYAPALRRFRVGEALGSEVIRKGTYANPILTSDGSWLLAAKAGPGGWGSPNTVVRIRMEDREELRVDLPAAETLHPVSRVEARKAVLILRIEDEDAGPEAEEYYLVIPETGAVERVRGEFRPWLDVQDRPFQQADSPEKVWAAIPGPDGTSFGRYDTSNFAFEAIATYPRLRFAGDDMWVDTGGKVVHVLKNGDLLALPFAR